MMAIAAAALLLAADLSTLIRVQTASAVVARVSGGAHHSYALVLLALVAIPLAGGAALRGSTAAKLALAGVGLVAAGIALLGDLPDVRATGLVHSGGLGRATPGPGFYLETLGAALLIASAGALLLLGGPPSGPGAGQRR